jgi:parallel beta-helix repeat protein
MANKTPPYLFSITTCCLIAFLVLVTYIPVNKCTANSSSSIVDNKPKQVFYVSTNGNDQWSGTLPSPNLSENDGPFSTLKRARDAIRTVKATGVEGQFTVLVRGGLYRLNETFVLGPEDSGTASYPTIFKAYDNERPILTGTRSITDFKSYKGRILKADLKESSLESYNFRQLFADGKRQTIARFPNYEPRDPIGDGFLYVKDKPAEGSKSKFGYQEGTVHDWANPQDGEVFIYPGPNYWNNIIPIAEIDYKSQIIILAGNASYIIKPGNRYFFQNLFEELDSPGEWYFDRRDKALYFWSMNDASLKTVNIPVLTTIIEIRGNNKSGAAAYITIEGFIIEGSEGTAVAVIGANNTVIARNTIFNAGGHGIVVQGGIQNTVIGNDINDVGDAGIIISGGDRKTLTPGGNRAENNYVHHTGIFNKYNGSIDCSGVGNIIAHNLVHSTPRIGISFDGNDHIIEYNHVHHVNQETQDSGAIYTCARDWTKRGNNIRYNYVHDSGGYGRNSASEKWRSPFYTWGIYLDDWTSGTTVYGNIIARTFLGGIDVHGGKDNIIENNIIIEGLTEQVHFQARPTNDPRLPDMFKKIKEAGYKKYPQLFLIRDAETGAMMSGNQFLRNIIYYTDKKAVLYNVDKNIDLLTTVWDYNTIYHAELPLLIPFIGAPAGQQWVAWKEKGLDKNSINADPLFKDLANGNFELLPDSPALKQGFKPIPIDKIGPYKHPLRASWPLENNSFELTESYVQ